MQLSGPVSCSCVCPSLCLRPARPAFKPFHLRGRATTAPLRLWSAQCKASGQDSDSPLPGSSKGISKPLIAGGAVGFGIAAFVALNLASGAPTFENLERASIPLDTALQNGKPTVIEFYASWCKICRELLPDTLEVSNHLSLSHSSCKQSTCMQSYQMAV